MTVFYRLGAGFLASRARPGRTQLAITFAWWLTAVLSTGRDRATGLSARGEACSGHAHGPAPRSNPLLPLLSQESAKACVVLFHLVSLALSAAVAKTRSGGSQSGRSGAAPRGTSPTALGAALGMLSRQGRFSSWSRKLGLSGWKEPRRGENGSLHGWWVGGQRSQGRDRCSLGPRGSWAVVTREVELQSPPPRFSRERLGAVEGDRARQFEARGRGRAAAVAGGGLAWRSAPPPAPGGGGVGCGQTPRSAARPGGRTAKFGLLCAEEGAAGKLAAWVCPGWRGCRPWLWGRRG